SSRRRHTRSKRDWSSDVCSSDLRIPRFSASMPLRLPRCQQGEERGRRSGIEAENLGIRERVGGEGADERPRVPEDEKHDSRRPEREASGEWVVARDGHRGRLVDHEVRGERPAPAANGEERGKPQAVERVARSEQARRQRAGPYAPSRADNPDERELRSAREHEQRQRASLYEGEARGGRYRAEGDRIGAARERDAKGIAKDPPPGISRSSFRRARRRSIARRSC